eukprot:jgi/Mesen1/2307/ME000155S01400
MELTEEWLQLFAASEARRQEKKRQQKLEAKSARKAARKQAIRKYHDSNNAVAATATTCSGHTVSASDRNDGFIANVSSTSDNLATTCDEANDTRQLGSIANISSNSDNLATTRGDANELHHCQAGSAEVDPAEMNNENDVEECREDCVHSENFPLASCEELTTLSLAEAAESEAVGSKAVEFEAVESESEKMVPGA